MDYKDYYATLGVPRTATKADIKKAFRKLARQHHPDVNKGDTAAEGRFKDVSEANEVLSDPKKRKLYDQLGANWQDFQRGGAGSAGGGTSGGDPFGGFQGFGGAAGGGAPGGVRFEFHGNPADLDGFSDFFRTFFAGGGRAAGGSGSRQTSTASRGAPGGGATGTRTRPGTLEDLFGGFGGGGRTTAAPPRQDAEAEVEVGLEDIFRGSDLRIEVDGKRMEVKLPRGVASGRRIRLTGKGPDGGDLYLKVKIRPHPVFTREGDDLRRDLRLTLGEALLGAEVPVGTLKGHVLLKIPAGTQSGRVFRLRGQGVPRLKGEGSGDLLVRVQVILPKDLSDEARAAADRFTELAGQPDPRSTDPTKGDD